jgi:hypothetical protein
MKKLILTFTTLLSLTGGLSAQVAIQCQDLMVVYAGIPSTFKAASSGEYKSVTANPSTVLATSAQIGSYITVSASGKDKKGNSVSLGYQKYLVKKAPNPELFWNGVGDGGQANKSAGTLMCRYGDNVPFSPSLGKFTIESYSITVSGVKGRLDGAGSTISAAHLNVLKEMKEGKISITVKFSGTTEGKVTAMFNL